jgi:serine/threonine-protein kinase
VPLSDAALRAPDRERYHPVGLLGVGGMGEVVLVNDRRIGRDVACKNLRAPSDRPDARPRFLREARVQARLEHPAVVPVYDLGLGDDQRPWFTMKRVRGLTLAEVLDAHARGDVGVIAQHPRRRLLAALVRVALAVDYAHTRGVLHRDLKPANIMLGDFGEVYVLDWGLARIDNTPEPSARPSEPTGDPEALVASGVALTVEGEVIGTPLYMAPEQLDGDSVSVDGRADVFALGAILYEVVALRRLRETAMDVRTGRTRRVSSVVPEVSPELDAICAKATARDPADRYPTARALAEAIESYLDGDQNEALRRGLATRHITRAHELFAQAATAQARVEALREALRAMALDPQNSEAQRLLLDVVTNVPDEIPPEAQESHRHATDGARLRLMRVTGPLWLTWLVVVPLAMVAGVRDWLPLATGATASLVGACLAWYSARQGVCSTRRVLLLGACAAVTVGTSACFLGPFVMPPLCGSTAAVVTALYARPAERRAVTGMIAAAVLAAFAVELLALVSPAWSFRQDQLTLFARVVTLPERMTVWFLLYMSVSFVVLPAVLVGRVRDAVARTERREFMQAWMVRKLFPNDGA